MPVMEEVGKVRMERNTKQTPNGKEFYTNGRILLDVYVRQRLNIDENTQFKVTLVVDEDNDENNKIILEKCS